MKFSTLIVLIILSTLITGAFISPFMWNAVDYINDILTSMKTLQPNRIWGGLEK